MKERARTKGIDHCRPAYGIISIFLQACNWLLLFRVRPQKPKLNFNTDVRFGPPLYILFVSGSWTNKCIIAFFLDFIKICFESITRNNVILIQVDDADGSMPSVDVQGEDAEKFTISGNNILLATNFTRDFLANIVLVVS